MKLEKVQRKNKNIVITIRTTSEDSLWMKKHRISPSLLFDFALEDLKQKVKEEKLK